ncbi:MAG: hypothetical protein V5786_06460 [Psychromonas sp.]
MNNYNNLQQLYGLSEIQENGVNIDFCYAFVCAMASSELTLQQWMPMLFTSGEGRFSSEKVASDFGQVILSIYQKANRCFTENSPLSLMIGNSLSGTEEAIMHFSRGYLHALLIIDNLQSVVFPEGSAEANLQQTCLLLLDKLASVATQDAQKITLFEQLPSQHDIVLLLPALLSRYGQQCLMANQQ